MRSRTRLRASPVHHFVDPSLGTSALGVGVEDLMKDLEAAGLYFESLVVRDSRVYCQALGGRLSSWRDSQTGAEVDVVLELPNGRWAGFEIKLGESAVDAAADSLLRLAGKIDVARHGNPLALVVITGGRFVYKRPDGASVSPSPRWPRRTAIVSGFCEMRHAPQSSAPTPGLDVFPQSRVGDEIGDLRSARSSLRMPLSRRCLVVQLVGPRGRAAAQFSRDRRRVALQSSRDLAGADLLVVPDRDVLMLTEGQVATRHPLGKSRVHTASMAKPAEPDRPRHAGRDARISREDSPGAAATVESAGPPCCSVP